MTRAYVYSAEYGVDKLVMNEFSILGLHNSRTGVYLLARSPAMGT
jgi:hypothetical protein